MSDLEGFNTKFAAMAIGNMMEYFDFAVFGAFADVLGSEFFPGTGDSAVYLLKSLSIFGAAFVCRPIGGVLLGWIGDTMGRRKALEISIASMLLPSFLISLLPSYNAIGYIATALLVLLRLVQGLAVGGEYVGALIYTIEARHGLDRGFWGACCKASGNMGSSLGVGAAALLRATLSSESLHSWGWRIPFIATFVVGVIGYTLRWRIKDDEDDSSLALKRSSEKREESAEYASPPSLLILPPPLKLAPRFTLNRESEAAPQTPVFVLLQNQPFSVVATILVAAFWSCGFYSTFVWMSYFISTSLIGNEDQVQGAWLIMFCMNLALTVSLPLCGLLGDLVGRRIGDEEEGFRRVMKVGLIVAFLCAIPAFALICTSTIWGTLLGLSVFVVSMSLFGSNLPAFMVSQFAGLCRYTGIGLAYNTANAIFAGTAPAVETALVMSARTRGGLLFQCTQKYGRLSCLRDSFADGRLFPAYYVMSISLMSLSMMTFGQARCTDEKTRLQTSFGFDDDTEWPRAHDHYEIVHGKVGTSKTTGECEVESR